MEYDKLSDMFNLLNRTLELDDAGIYERDKKILLDLGGKRDEEEPSRNPFSKELFDLNASDSRKSELNDFAGETIEKWLLKHRPVFNDDDFPILPEHNSKKVLFPDPDDFPLRPKYDIKKVPDPLERWDDFLPMLKGSSSDSIQKHYDQLNEYNWNSGKLHFPETDNKRVYNHVPIRQNDDYNPNENNYVHYNSYNNPVGTPISLILIIISVGAALVIIAGLAYVYYKEKRHTANRSNNNRVEIIIHDGDVGIPLICMSNPYVDHPDLPPAYDDSVMDSGSTAHKLYNSADALPPSYEEAVSTIAHSAPSDCAVEAASAPVCDTSAPSGCAVETASAPVCDTSACSDCAVAIASAPDYTCTDNT